MSTSGTFQVLAVPLDCQSSLAQPLKEAIAVLAPSGFLYGVFTLLAATSAYIIARKGLNRASAALLCTLLVLFVSTTVFWAYLLTSQYHDVMFGRASGPGASDSQCAETATLTINMVIADAVLWWRAWVLWPRNRIVHAIGAVLLILALSFGADATTWICSPGGAAIPPESNPVGTGFLYQGLSMGVAAVITSFVNNLAVMFLIGWKMITQRRIIGQYFGSGTRISRGEKVFALLLESGLIYCALWIVVMVWEIDMNDPNIVFYHRIGPHSFWKVFGKLVEGCLVPLAGIFSTAIIALVALNSSPVENGLSARKASDIDTTEHEKLKGGQLPQ